MIQGKMWVNFNTSKQDIIGLLKGIQESINPTFADILRKIDEQY